MNKFKVGDKVVYDGSAQAYSYYKKRLKKGAVYTVAGDVSHASNCIKLAEFPNMAGIYEYRFNLAKKQPKNKQMNKPKFTLEQGFIIEVNGNAHLWELFQKMAFERGLGWAYDNKTPNKLNSKYLYFWLLDGGKYGPKCLMQSDSETACLNDFYHFDAIKDFAQIVELISKINFIEVPTVNGYEAKYEKGSKTIDFGCAKISHAMLCYISNGAKPTDGNRSIKSITLDSGVTMTIEKIEKVLDYVRKVNG